MKSFMFMILVYVTLISIGLIINLISKKVIPVKERSKQEINNIQFKFNKWEVGTLVICVICLFILLAYHVTNKNNNLAWTLPYIFVSFTWNVVIIVSSYLNKTYIKPKGDNIRKFKTTVVIPVYNEDIEMVKRMLKSLGDQTTPADIVCMIEDGSLEENKCNSIFNEWASTYPGETYYQYVPNGGKREAQSYAFRKYMDITDVFVTVDSDGILDSRAIEEGIYPFHDDNIMSVGGVILDYNTKANWLTRIIGVSFVSAFTNGRAAYSRFKSVIVNCGCLAFYRKEVVENNLLRYLNQTIHGQKISSGDDRMMTQYAAIMGDTVFQKTSFAYTLNPVKFRHLANQRTRWWRSFWRCGYWFLQNQRINKISWWIQLYQTISSFIHILIFILTVFYYPIKGSYFPWHVFGYLIILGYMRNFRTVTVEREDMKKSEQLIYYILFSPLSTLLNLFLCAILQVYALATVWVVNWGTRKNVEVSINNGANIEVNNIAESEVAVSKQ
ncbi:MAG: glycosyltransferase [Lachnospiraceae bacterium]